MKRIFMAALPAVFLAMTVTPASPAVLLSEDFEGLSLRPFQSPTESNSDGSDWTPNLPPGWTMSFVGPVGDPLEFQGWRILDVDSWIATEADQGRSSWTRGGVGSHGSVLVADPDAYDDGTDVDPDNYTTVIMTPSIALRYVASNSVRIEFDSFYRNESPQRGSLSVTFDGGNTYSSIFEYDPARLAADAIIDERVVIPVNNPASGTLFFTFTLTGGNNWWWAIDDVVITGTPIDEPAPIIVRTRNDNGPGSLRRAISDAQPGDKIVFEPSVTGTIILFTGELFINKNLSIFGPCAKQLTISGNDRSRVFNIAAGVTADISGVTIAHGMAIVPNFGGGIQNNGTLHLTNCVLTGNSATTTNNSGNGGGAILNDSPGVLTLFGCTVSSNFSQFGGALYNHGALTALDCTISANSSAVASTIYSSGTLLLRSCTVASNNAAAGGGGLQNDGGSVILANTLIAGNRVTNNLSPDVFGTVVSQGYNLVGAREGSVGFTNGFNADQVGTIAAPLNPQLGPLADNGGCTPTHPLRLNSAAIDKGKSFGLTTDQRGAPRPYDFAATSNVSGGDGSDIGALESGLPQLNISYSPPNVMLTWPWYYGGFFLESATNLPSPTNWSIVPGTPEVVGHELEITNSPVNGNTFFRLRGQ